MHAHYHIKIHLLLRQFYQMIFVGVFTKLISTKKFVDANPPTCLIGIHLNTVTYLLTYEKNHILLLCFDF